MIESFRTVYEGGVGEIIEKKSKFIATVLPVESEEAALEFIEQMKKKYWSATHNCSAFVIGINNEIQRCSDDGEPSKTAGKPMLDVLLGEELHNVAVVVTRYFGGTLLGTGGLVRAYQGAIKEGLNHCAFIDKIHGIKVQIVTDYNGIGKLQYISAQMEVTFIDTEYTDIVIITAIIPTGIWNEFQNKVIEATNAKAQITELKTVFFANVSGNIVVYD